MTKEEVERLYKIWMFHKVGDCSCHCIDHNPENKNVCARERSWRAYAKARDEYIQFMRLTRKKVDLKDLFDSFTGMD